MRDGVALHTLWPRCSHTALVTAGRYNSWTPSGSGGSYGSGFLHW